MTENFTDNVSKKLNEQKPTREQTLAKSIDRHISVTANAGSGKTSVLVDRYYKIITEGDIANNIPPVEPRDIKAITFTNKAAAEMKERLVRKIAEESQATTDAARIEFLNELRVKLSNADISTIHSFCGTLLRAFPIEAGVSPNFKECTETDTFVIRKQVIGGVIDDILYEIDTEDSDLIDVEEFKELVYAVGGLGRLSDYLSRIVGMRMIFDRAKHLYELSFDEYVQKYYNSVEVILRKLLEKVRNSLQLVLDKGRFLDSEKHSAWRSNINTAINIAEWYLSGMFTMGSEFVIDQIANIATNIDNALKENKLFTKEWKMGARTLKSLIEEEDKDLIPEVENTLLSLFKLNKSLGNSEIDFKQFKYSKLLSKLAEKAIAKYDEELLQNDMLDFDNLILKANKLLTEYPDRELVANTLRDKIKYLMVDEFQDTDSVQYGLIREVIRNIGSAYVSSSNTNNNLFIVGDPKQSIYGFRGADVSVFNTAKEEIKVANKDASDEFIVDGEEIEANDNEAKGEIILKSTFRNTPDIAFFVNDVCNPMFEVTPSPFIASEDEKDEEQREFDKQFTKYGVKYEDLVTALITSKLDKTQLERMAEHLESRIYSKEEITDIINNLEDTGKGDDIFGSITLLNYVVPKDIVKLLKLSGAEINDLHHYDYLIDYILKLKEEKGADFKDFAVVSRTKPLLEELSLKLIERGVPFINNSSRGFYGIPEVQSIISLLKFISNYNDDVAFMSVLRSSFCGFDNTDLYFLSMVYKSKNSGDINFSSLSMFEKMEVLIKSNYIPENEEVRYRLDKYRATHKILRELIDTKLDLEPAIMLRKAFELFNWYNVISDSPYHERIKTNADKIVQMAREYVRQGFKNIYDFVNELEYLSENELTESEAVLQSSADQISLFTVHAAKGTEYKYLVYLSGDKAAKTNNIDGIYIDDYFGISFPFKTLSKAKDRFNSDEELINVNADKPEASDDEEIVKSTIYSLSNDKYVIKIKEEEKRIFYVGLTRAKKGLIIFSKINYTTKNDVGVINLKPGSLFSYMSNSIQVYDASAKDEEKYIKLDKYIENMVNKCIRINNSEVTPHVLDYRPIIINDDGNEVESKASRNLLLIAGKEHINCTLSDHTQKINLGIYVYAVNNNANLRERINLNDALDGNNIEEMTQILTSNISGKFISATEMKLYSNDKDKYQVKYLLGLHEDDKKNHYSNNDETEDEIELFTALDFGSATHKVFEYIKKWYKSGKIDELALDDILKIVMSAYYLLKDYEIAEKKAEIKLLVRDVIATGYFAKYNNFIEDSIAEYTILHSLSDNVLQGQLDMLIKNNKGEYEIWDWKTDKLNGNIDQLTKNYSTQMKQYAYLLSQLYPDQSEYKARLLFVRGAKGAKSDADWVHTHILKQEDLSAYEQEAIKNIQEINNHPFFQHADE